MPLNGKEDRTQRHCFSIRCILLIYSLLTDINPEVSARVELWLQWTCCSVNKSLSDSLQPHGLQHARLPCPSPSPRVCSNSCPLSQWFYFNHLILCCPLPFPLTFPSVNESVLCIRWPEYWSFRFCISPFSEYWGLISFRVDWFDLLTIQGTLKSLLQHDN